MFLDRRAELIAAAAEGCRRQARVNPVARDALRSLKQAEATRATIKPRMLSQYVRAWQADLERWRKHLVEVPRLGSLDLALKHLELTSVRVPLSVSGRRSRPGGRSDSRRGPGSRNPDTGFGNAAPLVILIRVPVQIVMH